MLQSRGAQKSSVCITTAERCLCAGLSSPRRLPPTESRALNWLAFAKACCGETWDAPASQCDSTAFSQAADQLGAQVPYRAACSDLTLQVGACPKMLPACTTTSETAQSVSGCRCHGQAPMLASSICHGCLHCHIHVNQDLDWLVQVLHMHVEPEQVPQIANGSVVGLIASRGGSADGSVAQQRCLGLGIVRSVDPVQDFLYLLTPVPAEQLQQVRYMSWLVHCLHSRCRLQVCCSSYISPVTASLCMPARCQAQRLCGTGGPPADGTIRASASTSARQERVVPIPGYGVLDSYRHRCWACAPAHRPCTARPHSPSIAAHAVHAEACKEMHCVTGAWHCYLQLTADQHGAN